eukprot:Ihof_evm6s69 gene=Ihof_evmTU6s69
MDSDNVSFVQTVLNWSPSQLKAGTRRPHNLSGKPVNPGGVLPTTFTSPEHYYSSLSDGVLEEVWGCLQQSLANIRDQNWVVADLTTVQTSTHTTIPSVLSFRPHGIPWSSGLIAAFSNTVMEMEWDGWVGGPSGSVLGLCGFSPDVRHGLVRVKVLFSTAQLRELSTSCATQPREGWKIRALGCSLTTHQRMCDALVTVPDIPFMPSLLSGLGGSADNEVPWMANITLTTTDLSPSVDYSAISNLNIAQQKAIKSFVSAGPGELQLLEGPPGTGKTMTISAMIQVLIGQGKRCLVCAPSNKAIQVLAERFMRDIEKAGKGGVAAAMVTADERVPADNKYLRELGTQTWGKTLAEKLAGLIEELTPLTTCTSLDADGCKLVQSVQSMLISLQKDIRRAAPTFDNKANLSKSLKGAVDLLSKVTATFKINSKPATKPAAKPKRRYSKGSGSISEGSNENIAPGGPTIGTLIQDCNVILLQVQHGCEAGPEELELLNHAQVVFGTLAVMGRTVVRTSMRAVDVVLVDEAAQSTEAETCIAFQFKPQRCLLIGDINQLPATVLSSEAKKRGYGRSLMERLVACKYPQRRLAIQYRMNPAIRQWPSTRFYESHLMDGPDTANHTAPWHCEPYLGAYVFIDCSEGQERHQGNSYANDCEANESVSLLRHLYSYYGVDVANRAVVLTFYQAQVENIKTVASEAYWGGNDVTVRVATVDSFQGCETDIVILSMVRANRKETMGFLKDYRRLNVALTRARSTMIVLGHAATLTSVLGSDVQSLVNDAQDRGLLFAAKNVQASIKQERKNKTAPSTSTDQ